MENTPPVHSFHLFDGPVVYIYPVVVSPMRDMSVALPCCSNVVHPVINTLSFTAREPNVLYFTAQNANKYIHFVKVSLSCVARALQSLARLMILISQHQYSMQLCLYCHDLIKIVLLMYCLPQENPRILAYIAFMLAVRNMILKHDFLAHITCYFSKSATLSSSLQQLLHGAESQGAQLELLYYLQSHLPPCLCLPWLFPVLDLSSLYIVGSFRSQKPLTNNSSRSPFFPPSLQHSILNDSRSHTDWMFACGGGGQHVFTFEAIHPYITAGSNVCHDHACKFVDHVDSVSQASYPVQQNFVHAKVPLGDVLPYLPLRLGHKIARLHHIAAGSHVSKSEFIHYFENHDCVSCNLYSSVFAVVNSKAMKDKLCKR